MCVRHMHARKKTRMQTFNFVSQFGAHLGKRAGSLPGGRQAGGDRGCDLASGDLLTSRSSQSTGFQSIFSMTGLATDASPVYRLT